MNKVRQEPASSTLLFDLRQSLPDQQPLPVSSLARFDGAIRWRIFMTRPERTTLRTSIFVFLMLLALALPICLFAQAPTFGQPTISGIQGVGFEQDIRLDPT